MKLVGKILDLSFNLRRIIDVYNSFIWNEYYIGYGDFQLKFPMDASALDYVKEGWYLSIAESDKLMIIEKISIDTDVQAGNFAIIEGRSLESILLRRIIRNDIILNGNLQTAILRLLQSNVLTSTATNRRMYRLSFSHSDDARIKAITTDVEYSKGENLYDAIISLCEYNRVGFKIIPNYEDTSFELSLYMGTDRSYAQNDRPWVVFSPKYENIKSTSMAIDTRELRNVAIVESTYTLRKTITNEDGSTYEETEERTLVVEVNNSISDMERREIFVSSSLKPDEIDKSKFGKKEDRVNIRDYQEYLLLYFDSAAYKAACDAVDEKYSSRIDRPQTEQVWEKTETRYIGGSSGTTEVKTVTTIDSSGLHKDVSTVTHPKNTKVASSSKAKARSSVSLLASSSDIKPSDPGHPSNKPSWLETPANQGFTLVTKTESTESWRKRNARTFAAWENAYPDRRDYERWGWDFPNHSKELEYQQALRDAQAAIDAEYESAIADAEQMTKSQMYTQGLIELAPYLIVTNFDGEVDPNVQFLYGRDYNMGDIVQIVNEFDFQATTRVVSMLFSEEDGEGFKAIPSFESDDPSEVEL